MQVMREKEIFSLQDYRATTSKVKAEIKKQQEEAHKLALVAILNPLPRSLSRTIMWYRDWCLAYGFTLDNGWHRAVIGRIL
jgi:hypothetical protein